MTAMLLVPAAAPGVAPIDGPFCDGSGKLRQAIGGLQAKLRRGNALGGSVRREEEIGVENEARGVLYL
jgi:hypothetical protein